MPKNGTSPANRKWFIGLFIGFSNLLAYLAMSLLNIPHSFYASAVVGLICAVLTLSAYSFVQREN